MTEGSELTTLTIERPDEALFKKSEDLLEIAQGYKISNPDMALAAGEELRSIKAIAKELEAKRTAITKPINKALREVNALFKPAKDWLKQAEGILKSKLLEYQAEQDRIAREAQAKADAEAQKERKKLERKAKLADTVGLPTTAEEFREEAETKVAPMVQSAAPKMSGIATRKTWKAEVTDKKAFVKHVVEKRPDLLGLVHLSQSALNDLARLHKDKLDMPGIKAVEETTMTARGS